MKKKHKFRQETEAVRAGRDLAKKTAALSTRRSIRLLLLKSGDMQEQVRATHTDVSTRVTAIQRHSG